MNGLDKEQLFYGINDLSPELKDCSILEEKRLSQHLRYEGRINSNVVNRIKASKAEKMNGYKCEVCGFDFSEHYGELGENFIELHHLTMYKNMKTNTSRQLKEDDFAILCSNCHKMIHKLPKPQNNKKDIIQLKEYYRK